MSVRTDVRRNAKLLGLLLGLGGLLLSSMPARASDYPLENVIPKEPAEKLAKLGVTNTGELLTKGAKAKDRRTLAKAAGVTAKLLLQWVELSDVVRIKGVGQEMAALLRAAGVKTVAKLKGQRAKTLLARMLKVNEKKKISENPPNEGQLAHWIGEAKKLEIVLR